MLDRDFLCATCAVVPTSCYGMQPGSCIHVFRKLDDGSSCENGPYWSCDICKEEWFADSGVGSRQCPKCGTRKWNDGMARNADPYQQALVIRHLNPYRRFLSPRQKVALMSIATNKRPESARKAAQTGQGCASALLSPSLRSRRRGIRFLQKPCLDCRGGA